jgi:hypothetical protein
VEDIARFVVVALLLSVPLYAQHGGEGRGTESHGGPEHGVGEGHIPAHGPAPVHAPPGQHRRKTTANSMTFTDILRRRTFMQRTIA